MQSDGDDLYALLEVHPKASPEVIKKAYHTLMQKNHPDRGGDVQVAQRINQAYDVLIDRDARQRYDQQQLRRRTLLSQLENRKQQEKAKVERQQRDAAAAAPAELKNLQGEYRSPMLWGSTVLVADERAIGWFCWIAKGARSGAMASARGKPWCARSWPSSPPKARF